MEHSSRVRAKKLRVAPPSPPAQVSSELSRQSPLANKLLSNGRCRLLELPPELREAIWLFTVTEWTPSKKTGRGFGSQGEGSNTGRHMLHRNPIRLDRFNRPPPPSITRVSRQLRHETLHLYYESNQFELWRPLFWIHDWSFSTLIDWLTQLGPRMQWVNDIVLLYKHESELEEHDIDEALAELGFEFGRPGVISNRQELSDFELSHEALGLPRHFGRRRRDRWIAGSSG